MSFGALQREGISRFVSSGKRKLVRNPNAFDRVPVFSTESPFRKSTALCAYAAALEMARLSAFQDFKP